MQTDQWNEQPEEPADSGPDFGCRNSLEVGVQLRNLLNRGDFLTVRYNGGQLVTRILDVDVQERIFVFDWGALAEQNKGVLAAQCCIFHASPEGVRMEFTIGAPRETRFDGLPAFEAMFPKVLFYMQRREYFRVEAPILAPYVCRYRPPSGDTFRFEVHDLSLGGLGLRSTDERVAELPLGTVFTNAELFLNTHGTLSLSLQLVSHRVANMPSGLRRYKLGFRFLSLPSRAENTLQQLITQLEMKRRAQIVSV
jgi:c-di-GMP-binding flagellar brake protein YcgR